jgi:hypothetical protein
MKEQLKARQDMLLGNFYHRVHHIRWNKDQKKRKISCMVLKAFWKHLSQKFRLLSSDWRVSASHPAHLRLHSCSCISIPAAQYGMDTSIPSCAVCMPNLITSQWLEWSYTIALSSCAFMQSLATAIVLHTLPRARHIQGYLLSPVCLWVTH